MAEVEISAEQIGNSLRVSGKVSEDLICKDVVIYAAHGANVIKEATLSSCPKGLFSHTAPLMDIPHQLDVYAVCEGVRSNILKVEVE